MGSFFFFLLLLLVVLVVELGGTMAMHIFILSDTCSLDPWMGNQ